MPLPLLLSIFNTPSVKRRTYGSARSDYDEIVNIGALPLLHPAWPCTMKNLRRVTRKSYAMKRMARAIERAIHAQTPAEEKRSARWAAAWGLLCGIHTNTPRLRSSEVQSPPPLGNRRASDNAAVDGAPPSAAHAGFIPVPPGTTPLQSEVYGIAEVAPIHLPCAGEEDDRATCAFSPLEPSAQADGLTLRAVTSPGETLAEPAIAAMYAAPSEPCGGREALAAALAPDVPHAIALMPTADAGGAVALLATDSKTT